MEIDISKRDKAEVLAALYNRAEPQGMGFTHYIDKDMTKEEAQEILDEGRTYFDYFNGRVMKVDLSGDILNTGLYDRDNGLGAAAHALRLEVDA